VLTEGSLNENVVRAEYSVRGTLYKAAQARAREGKEVIYTNVGNPQGLGQKPITFFRQVLALVSYPEMLSRPELARLFPADAIARARKYLSVVPGGTGAYQDSQGNAFVRSEVAEFILKRDGQQVDPSNIFLTDGASMGISLCLQVTIRGPRDGILLPIPQYPLYSASVRVLGGEGIGYFLDEEKGWGLNISELERAVVEARAKGIVPRALVVINPGNPTGSCLTAENIREVAIFCRNEGIVIFADEVYQENVYNSAKPFVSFRKVIASLGPHGNGIECFSFHSASKGFIGECGRRSAYFDCLGISQFAKDQIYKLMSMNLSTNVDGQIFVGLMVNPPKPGDPSYGLYQRESTGIIESMARRASMMRQAFSNMEGVSCNMVDGAMYIYPSIEIPQGAVLAAKQRNQAPDEFYCLELLDATGICCIPGSGFGQKEGTFHFRTTILPPEEKMPEIIKRFANFHRSFVQKYQGTKMCKL